MKIGMNNWKSWIVERTKEKVKITPMMISLLVYEFCVRWMINAFDSTYGSYLMEDYGITESTYS